VIFIPSVLGGKPAFPPQGAGTPDYCFWTPAFSLHLASTEEVRNLPYSDTTPPPDTYSRVSQQQISRYEKGEGYGDYAVRGEESGVEAGKVVGLDERMLVEQQQHDCHYAGGC